MPLPLLAAFLVANVARIWSCATSETRRIGSIDGIKGAYQVDVARINKLTRAYNVHNARVYTTCLCLLTIFQNLQTTCFKLR